MYNLIVTGDDLDAAVITVPRERYLEYTSVPIRRQLESLSKDAIDSIKTWPCILMQEGRGSTSVHLVLITSVSQRSNSVSVSVKRISHPRWLSNGALWKLRVALEIAEFEFSRQHWSVKDQGLLEVLARSGRNVPTIWASFFRDAPLPSRGRSALISARSAIAKLSHQGIDDLLLNSGVSGLKAGRELGSRRNRAQAIVEFAIENPGAVTASNELLSTVLCSVRDFDAAPNSSEINERGKPAMLRGAEVKFDRSDSARVFVVHGRNDDARGAVVEHLKSLGLIPIVLHDRPNAGRHLLTKLIDEAELVTFAVVIMTGDDVGGRSHRDLRPRARQNVILELGYFIAHLGLQRVCALVEPEIEAPSDFDGIVYVQMGPEGSWKDILERELVAAGMSVTSSEPKSDGERQ